MWLVLLFVVVVVVCMAYDLCMCVCVLQGSLLVGTKLEGVQQSLQKSRQLLQQNRRRRSSSLAVKEEKPQKDLPSKLQNDLLSSSSANLTDLLSQIQQMQEERVGLIE